MIGYAVKILLAKLTLRPNQLIPRGASCGYQHHEDAMIRNNEEAHMFNHAAGQGRRNEDAEPSRNRRENLAGALHHCFRSFSSFQFAAYPLAVLGTCRGLRRHLLDKKAIRGRRGHATGRRVGLVEIAALLELRHYIPDRGGAQRLYMALGGAARGYGFARLDIRADDVGQNLPVSLLL